MGDLKDNLQPLTPRDDIDISAYQELLDTVFENPAMRNIAITGPYGAGKTSIIKTYLKHTNPVKNIIYVALAHFIPINNGVKPAFEPETPGIDERVIEGKIINQLIHQIPQKSAKAQKALRRSNFKVKSNLTFKEHLKLTFLIVAFILALSHFFSDPKLITTWANALLHGTNNSILQSIAGGLHWLANPWTYVLSGLTWVCVGIWGIGSLIDRHHHHKLFKKVSVQGTEIEMFNTPKDSQFDKYLDDILYLLEEAEIDVMVFEDLDRYCYQPIFDRLREVNELLNRRCVNKRVTRFFYLMRDDLYVSKDRTKFFDLMIPVIPVIDGSNSYDQLLMMLNRIRHSFAKPSDFPKKRNKINELREYQADNHVQSSELDAYFDKTFLLALSVYIDDMRILKNICNEFYLYHQHINTTGLDFNKLLAMMAYKNIFPEDYSDLHLRKGYVYSLFEQKEIFRNNKRSLVTSRINDIERRLESVNQERLEAIEELEILENYYKSKVETYSYNAVEKGKNTVIWEEWVKKRPMREQAIYDSTVDQQTQLVSEKQALQAELKALDYKKLNELITAGDREAFFNLEYLLSPQEADLKKLNAVQENKKRRLEEIQKSDYFPLLKYLIGDGFIDERYSRYMNHFYEHSLSIEDERFIHSLFEKTPLPFNYRLNNPTEILRRLSVKDFNQREILNADLLTELLSDEVEYSAYLKRMFHTVEIQEVYTFFEDYFTEVNEARKHHYSKIEKYRYDQAFREYAQYATNVAKFVQNVHRYCPAYSRILLTTQWADGHFVNQYILILLAYLSEKEILELNEDQRLVRYISAQRDFLNSAPSRYLPRVGHLLYLFNLIEMVFDDLDRPMSKQMLKGIYENRLYSVNVENVRIILRKIFKYAEKDINQKPITLIQHHPETPLYMDVMDNISVYLDELRIHASILRSSENTFGFKEGEEAVCFILNHEDISLEQKIAYLSVSDTMVSTLTDIQDDSEEKRIWTCLTAKNLIAPTADNLFRYVIAKKGYDKAIIDFINTHSLPGDFSAYKDKVHRRDLFGYTVRGNGLDSAKYEALLSQLDFYYLEEAPRGIAPDKVDILIRKRILRMSEPMLGSVRERYPEKRGVFICHNIEAYVGIIQNNPALFDPEELLRVLDEENIEDLYKLALLAYADGPISIRNKAYSDRLIHYVLQAHLNAEELGYIFHAYGWKSREVRQSIMALALQYEDLFFSEEGGPISPELCRELVVNDGFKLDRRQSFFARVLTSSVKMDRTEAAHYLQRLSLSKFAQIFDKSGLTFPINDFNETLLKGFIAQGWIADIEPDEKGEKCKVLKRKQTTKQ